MVYCGYCYSPHILECKEIIEHLSLKTLNLKYNCAECTYTRDRDIDDAVVALVLTLQHFVGERVEIQRG